MWTVEFGEIRTSRLGFGCGSVMGRVGRRDSLNAMHAAWDAGVTLFDTARSYGYGEAEGILGEFLAGKRSQATVVTKFGILPAPPSRWKRLAKPLVRRTLSAIPQAGQLVRRRMASEISAGHFDVRTLRTSLEESLRQLRTDYVDVLLAHDATASVMAQEDLVTELQLAVRSGKARRAGLACTPAVAALAIETASTTWSAVQFPVNLSRATVIGIPGSGHWFRMANHPFGGAAGISTTKARLRRMMGDNFLSEELREKLSRNFDCLHVELTLNTALNAAEAVVPSMLQLSHLRANIAAIEDGRFSAEELAQIRERLLA